MDAAAQSGNVSGVQHFLETTTPDISGVWLLH
jgi:hypothetical protein